MKVRDCRWLVLAALAAVPVSLRAADDSERYVRERAAMISEIERNAALTAFDTGRHEFSKPVMQALAAVPRHEFVPDAADAYAYEDRPLSIGYGQTISQPYIVALMTDLLEPRPGHVVLELGTGSGYQAAVLSGLVAQVYTVEIVEPLAIAATSRLAKLGYTNVHVRHADGYHGWPEHGPYDSIVVTAAAGSIPPPLIAQLKPGGRMVIPVGAPFLTQTLMLVTKDASGRVATEQILPVRFVPLTGAKP